MAPLPAHPRLHHQVRRVVLHHHQGLLEEEVALEARVEAAVRAAAARAGQWMVPGEQHWCSAACWCDLATVI